MRFTVFPTVRSPRGEECTYQLFTDLQNAEWIKKLCAQIAAEKDVNRRGDLKKKLPVVTWQALFNGRRIAREAVPSGLFMLDIDHIENPGKLYAERMCGENFKTEHGIVYVSKTASLQGLRVVALCRPEFKTLEECQRWLANEIGVAYDSVCKDWARSSYVTCAEYNLYMNAAAIWEDNDGKGVQYEVKEQGGAKEFWKSNSDQREGLFGSPKEYKGLSYESIIREWFRLNGGEPAEGERNSKLYQLATRLRYITDFNEATLLRVLPDFGLPEEEMRSLVHSACTGTRASKMPFDLEKVLQSLERQNELTDGEELVEEEEVKMPPMPPIIRQYVEAAPDDFKQAVALCQLPILGTLGTRLRARYLDGAMHSPSFQVSLEAPQASGKSFMRKLVEVELAQLLEHDEQQRQREREYDAKVREMKLLNIKVNANNKDEVLGSRPKSLIRYVPATMSITKLLMRMNDAQGMHLFAMAEEIDTVTKAFKRGFSSYSDLLRVAFDNGLYGQDYASENSFSGIIPIFYNMLSSGTPKAMRRFYPDVEDGLVSRVCFVTLPDQFGKRMPVWNELTHDQKAVVDINLVRLNEVSIVGDEVQPEHVMKMEWLNKELERWILEQQARAVKENDRTRDVFCRRSAVVGFRAGMLAWFLYAEKNTPTVRRNVIRFALWVAHCMLTQHLLRFTLQTTQSNTNPYEEALNALPDEFTRDQLCAMLVQKSVDTPERNVINRWKMAGLIKVTEEKPTGKKNRITAVKFKKIK